MQLLWVLIFAIPVYMILKAYSLSFGFSLCKADKNDLVTCPPDEWKCDKGQLLIHKTQKKIKFNGQNLFILQVEIMAKEICIAALIKEKSDELTTKICISYGSASFQKLNMPIARKCLLTYWTCSAFDIQSTFLHARNISLKTNFEAYSFSSYKEFRYYNLQ